MTTTPPTVNMETRIAQFVQLRDKIKTQDEAHKKQMAPYREMLDKLGGMLLDHLKQIGADSVASGSGTVYRTVKQSASIADGDKFWEYIVTNEAWDLIDRKANVTAVADFIEEYNTPPPGVNFTSTMTVGVRRK